MKKNSKLLLLSLCAFTFMINVNASCDENVTCDSSVGGIFGAWAHKCKGVSPSKVYNYNDEIYGFCYKHGNEYFYEVRFAKKDCAGHHSAAVLENNKSSSLLYQQLAKDVYVLTKNNEKVYTCAPYFSVHSSSNTYTFWYYKPTDKKWVKGEELGKVSYDEETYESVVACVAGKIDTDPNSNFCKSTEKDKIYSSAIDECIKNNTDYTDEMFEKYKKQVKGKLKDSINFSTLSCKLKEKCGTSNADTALYLGRKGTLESQGYSSEGAKSQAASEIFKNNSEMQSCVIMNSVLTSSEQKQQADTYDSVNNDVDQSIDEVKEHFDDVHENFKIPDISIKDNTLNCKELVGENLSKIIKLIITILQIAGAIIAIVNGMITLIPAVISKDAEALKSAEKKCITMAIVLVLIILLPTLLIFLSNIFGYDLSCIV